MAQLVGTVLTLVGLAVAALALGVAALQLQDAKFSAQKSEITAEAQAVLAVDQFLAQGHLEEVRRKINDETLHVPVEAVNTANEEAVALRRYVAAFERLGLLIDKGVITIEVADEFYGDRLQRLLVLDPVKAMVAPNGEGKPGWEGKQGWRNFILLWNKVDEHWRNSIKYCWDEQGSPPAVPKVPKTAASEKGETLVARLWQLLRAS